LKERKMTTIEYGSLPIAGDWVAPATDQVITVLSANTGLAMGRVPEAAEADIDAANSSTIGQEEIFGPVVAIIRYDGDDDAVRLSNESNYGLGGTVWTEDRQRGLAVARHIKTGGIGVNGYSRPDTTAPYGGMKASGLGRELGPEGMAEYLQFQSIYDAYM
jgi:acyl-CoA reductase-like NAD-dependent aldehyde dehydrogenase